MAFLKSSPSEGPATIPSSAVPALRAGELAGLDGLRAISVSLVMISHFGFGTIVPGGLGVTVFFFISGFLITTLMLREARLTGTISIKQFYARRLLRLQPELWAMLAISGVIGVVSGAIMLRSIDIAAALLYFTNYLFIVVHSYGGSGNVRWPLLWSLAIEEHYYLTYPILFSFMIKRRGDFMKFMLFVLLADAIYRSILHYVGFSDEYLYRATDTRLDSIAYGCLTSFVMWYLPLNWLVSVKKYGSLFGFLAVFLLLVSLIYRAPAFRETWRYSMQGLALSCAFVCFYASSVGPSLTGILDQPVLKWMGRMSYGAYLWHFEIAHLLSDCCGVAWYGSPSIAAAISTIIFSAVTFGVAALSYTLLQKPLMSFRHRFSVRAA